MSLEPEQVQGVIAAAGTLPWRVVDARLEVAVIHRPRYDDWSWPKGKLDPGEHWPTAAVRETQEETGYAVALGRSLPRADYVPMSKSRPEAKRVHYWAAQVVGGGGELEHEVDDLAWLTPHQARQRLTYERDAEQLDALEAAYDVGTLVTRTFAIVRHAKARPRKEWSKADSTRPLDNTGSEQADELVAVLGCYGISRLLSSTSTRCVDTLKPYAKATKTDLDTSGHLSEEGFAKRPQKGVATMLKAFADPRSSAVCTHGPVLPELLLSLVDYAHDGAGAALAEAASTNLDKGGVLIAHVSEQADGPWVVDVERHHPMR